MKEKSNTTSYSGLESTEEDSIRRAFHIYSPAVAAAPSHSDSVLSVPAKVVHLFPYKAVVAQGSKEARREQQQLCATPLGLLSPSRRYLVPPC